MTRANPLRGNRRRLLLLVNPDFRADIAKSTISRWLIQVVRLAYSNANTMPPHCVTAHEVRAAEARVVTLERLMAAVS